MNNSNFNKNNNKQKGQTIPYLLVMIVILVICWAMMINIAKLLNDRIMMQNAADNAALSVAVYRARVLNHLGKINYLISCLLYDGPVAGLTEAALEIKPKGWFNYYGGGLQNGSIKKLIKKLLNLIPGGNSDAVSEAINSLLGGISIESTSDEAPVINNIWQGFTSLSFWSQGSFRGGLYFGPLNTCSIGGIFPPPEFCDRMYLWDSRKKVACIGDMSHISYRGEKNPCLGKDIGPKNGDFFIKLLKSFVKAAEIDQDSFKVIYPANAQLFADKIAKRQVINSNGEPCGADHAVVIQGLSLGLNRVKKGIRYYQTRSFCLTIPIINIHCHLFWADSKYEEDDSWLYADQDTFPKSNKITVIAVKYGNSNSNARYPLIGRWIGIKWPDIYTISSAAVYNRKGPMFPVDNKRYQSNSISRVAESYLEAKDGGWYAHLVPEGKGVIH